MKMYLLLGLAFIISAASAQDPPSKREQKRAVKEQEFDKLESVLENLNYEFIASKANPQNGQQIDLTTHSTFFKIINDSIEVDLPFFGRAFHANYGGTGGIRVNNTYSDYQFKTNKKKLIYVISLSAKGEYDSYEFNLSVSYSGSATLFVNSINRAGISYYGKIKNLKKSKE